jgi:hypothetical protein
MKIALSTLFYCIIIFTRIDAQAIVLDESYDDWDKAIAAFVDPIGDGAASSADFSDVKVSNDALHLFVYLDINYTLNIQANNQLSIWIDIDNNAATGLNINGIGVDLLYRFGSRTGTLYRNSATYQIWHSDIRLTTLPTVTSDRFEIGMARQIKVPGLSTINMGSTIRFFVNDERVAGDRAPNTGHYTYTFDNSISPAVSTVNLAKQSIDDIRIVSYNVLRDNLLDAALDAPFRRIFKAAKPDIIGFCEIYDASSAQVATKIESFLPSTSGQQWYHDQVNPDIRIVSRYPIKQALALDGNGVFLLNVKGKDLLYIVCHLPCCDNEISRQREVDKIMGFVRDVRYGISSINVGLNTPIVIGGDMNFVGLREQVETFISGNIINNGSFGPDFKPDWDNSNLEDAKPKTTGLPSTITWYNEDGSYSAGRLDYIFYTGSTFKLKNSFSLWTPDMTSTQLSQNGLTTFDIVNVSDHTPLVTDFSFDLTSASKEDYVFPAWRYYEGMLTIDAIIKDAQIYISDSDGRRYHSSEQTILDNKTIIELKHLPSEKLFFITVMDGDRLTSLPIWRN